MDRGKSLLTNIFSLLAWVSFSIVFLFYGCYFIVLIYFYRRNSPSKKTEADVNPFVSIIVPVHNEEKVIVQKMQNIEELEYPNDRIEVIFVDGQSTDRTPQLITDQALRCRKSIRLIKQERRDGYTNAVIRGILDSQGEIVVAMDAASYHYPDALKRLVGHFAESEIGAVTGKEIVLGDSKQLGPQLEKSYRYLYDFMRKAETKMDLTADSKGEILAVRREICVSLIPRLRLSVNASFDSCVPYQAKLMGYRTIYDDLARYYEHAPASFNDRMKVQIRRATVLIAPLFMFKNMILNKKFGLFGMLIMPVHFIIDCLLPGLFMFGIASLVIATVLNPIGVIIIWGAAAVAIVASRKSRSILLSFIQSQFALFVALFRLAGRRKSLFIESVQSTRVQK